MNTGSLAQAAMLCAPPEGMAKLQEHFQHFVSRFLFGILTSSCSREFPLLCGTSVYALESVDIFRVLLSTTFKEGYGMFPCMKLGRKFQWLLCPPLPFLTPLQSLRGTDPQSFRNPSPFLGQLLTAAVMFCSFCKHPPFSCEICHFCHQQFSAINGESS